MSFVKSDMKQLHGMFLAQNIVILSKDKDSYRDSFFFFSCDRVSLCRLGCPGTHSVDQAGLKLRNSSASASQVLGLKACAITAQQCHLIMNEKGNLCYANNSNVGEVSQLIS